MRRWGWTAGRLAGVEVGAAPPAWRGMPPRVVEAATPCTHLGVAQQRARNAHELPLAGGEVGAALVDGAAEARRVAQCEGQ